MFIVKIKNSLVGFVSSLYGSKKVFKSVNSMVYSIDKIYFVISWFAASLISLIPLVSFGILGFGADKFLKLNSESAISPDMLFWIALGFAVLYTSSKLIGLFTELNGQIYQERLDLFIDDLFIKKLISLDLGRLSDPSFIELRDLARERGSHSIKKIFESELGLVSCLVGSLFSLGAIITIDPIVFFISCITIIPRFIKMVMIDEEKRWLFKYSSVIRRRKREYEYCLSNKKALIQNKLFMYVESLYCKYRLFADKLVRESLDIERKNVKIDNIISILDGCFTAFIFFHIGSKITGKNIEISEIFILVGSIQTLKRSVLGISKGFVDMSSSIKDYTYWEDFMNTNPLVNEDNAKPIVCLGIPRIEMCNVDFSYPSKDSLYALTNTSIIFEKGDRVAIVGRNGSGKTTTAKLLAKIYNPVGGKILIDGCDLSGITQKSWLKYILYSTQDSSLADFSIKESLTGDDDVLSMDNLKLALDISGSWDFVSKLKDGIDTQIGEDWPGGIGFSTGQKQRLKMASAFYRLLSKDVFVGIFDEPMSHCDSETREKFYSSLKRFSNKTIIVVAHDPLYLHHFKRVIVYEGGRVTKDLNGSQAIISYQSEIALKLSSDL